MKYIKEIKSLRSDYKLQEIFKSILIGFIFFILLLILLIALTINISFIHVRYINNFIVMASLIAGLISKFGIKLSYKTLLNYNSDPVNSFEYSKEINMIVIPVIVFLLGLLPIIFV